MSTLTLLAALPSISQMLTWFVYVAVLCLVVWGIRELVRWAGIPIPRPVWIILTVVIGIMLILWVAQAFGLVH